MAIRYGARAGKYNLQPYCEHDYGHLMLQNIMTQSQVNCGLNVLGNQGEAAVSCNRFMYEVIELMNHHESSEMDGAYALQYLMFLKQIGVIKGFKRQLQRHVRQNQQAIFPFSHKERSY